MLHKIHNNKKLEKSKNRNHQETKRFERIKIIKNLNEKLNESNEFKKMKIAKKL